MSDDRYDYDDGYYDYEAEVGDDGSEVSAGVEYRSEYDRGPEPQLDQEHYDYYDYTGPEAPEGQDDDGVEGNEGNSVGVQPVSLTPEDILCKDHLLLLDTKCVKCSAVKVALGPQKLKELGVQLHACGEV